MDFKNIKDCIYKVSDHGDVKDMRTGKKLHKKIANKKTSSILCCILRR